MADCVGKTPVIADWNAILVAQNITLLDRPTPKSSTAPLGRMGMNQMNIYLPIVLVKKSWESMGELSQSALPRLQGLIKAQAQDQGAQLGKSHLERSLEH